MAHIDSVTPLQRKVWATGLREIMLQQDSAYDQRVVRSRDGSAYAIQPEGSPMNAKSSTRTFPKFLMPGSLYSRHWVAAELYNKFNFTRLCLISEHELYVYIKPLCRMPVLRVYVGLIYAEDPNDNKKQET